jgi:oxygen-independent coproporphyrinogen-3 oxidase
LIYEPGTPLYDEYISGKVKAQNEDNDVELYEITDKILSSAGFEQYEVSNYAKPGFKCKHNLKYWSCDEYFGFGPSAHSYENGRRYWNYRDNDIYFAKIAQNQAPEESGETLSRKQMLFEKLYLGLRAEGVNLEEFKESGVDFTSGKSDFLLEMSDCNYLIFDENKIKLTNKGYFIGDKITLELSESIDDIC